jgi:SAM-dependent methyltransferase
VTDAEKKEIRRDESAGVPPTARATAAKRPFFSVVIPAYEMHGRGVEFLEFSFAILARQTFRDFEIVVSDHSSDAEIESACKRWQDRLKIKYRKYADKRGSSSANLNHAISQADGNWIKILFQDDFLLGAKALETIHARLVATEQATWIAVGCEHTMDGTTLNRPFRPRWNDDLFRGKNTLSSPSVIAFRRDTSERFDEDLMWLMDVDFYQRMFLRYGEPLYLYESLVVNRVWGNRLSDTLSEAVKQKEHAILEARYARPSGLGVYAAKLGARLGFRPNEPEHLGNGGERMDIDYHDMPWERMDIYQRSHFMRYRFAQEQMQTEHVIADMACGSGYGTMMLAERSREAHGYDIDGHTIAAVKRRYARFSKVAFHKKNLLHLEALAQFDQIVSFETVEHFPPEQLDALFQIFHRALKPGGRVIFSTPYDQEDSPASRRFHQTFHIKEGTLESLLRGRFAIEKFLYQNYDHHELADSLDQKHFIICLARRTDEAAS